MTYLLLAIIAILATYSVLMTWSAIVWRNWAFKFEAIGKELMVELIRATELLERWHPMVRPTPGELIAYEAEDWLAGRKHPTMPPKTDGESSLPPAGSPA